MPHVTCGGCSQRVAEAVTGALDEADAARHRIAHQRLDVKTTWLFHQAVNQQPMLFRIDFRHTVVVALEVQPVRCDYSVEGLQWRERYPVPGAIAPKG